MSASGTFTTSNGLAADRYGDPDAGPPLVLLHGLGSDRRQWGPLLRELGAADAGRAVLTVDLPGHGDSPWRELKSLDETAAVVHQVVVESGLSAPVVLGHSLGGAIATAYAARYPTSGVVNVDQPLLVGGFADLLRRNEDKLRGPDYGAFWLALTAGMGLEALPARARPLVRPDEIPPRNVLLTYWHELLTLPSSEVQARHDARLERIASAATPYHYIAGQELSTGHREWLEAALPEVRISVLDGSGHFPHLVRPDTVARILTAFGD